MFYYKFRVYFDEVEDFVRDIEILANDNFESLHNILYKSIGLEGNELASFSLCDSKWNKQNEITLIDMKDDDVADTPEYEEEDGYTTQNSPSEIHHEGQHSEQDDFRPAPAYSV